MNLPATHPSIQQMFIEHIHCASVALGSGEIEADLLNHYPHQASSAQLKKEEKEKKTGYR